MSQIFTAATHTSQCTRSLLSTLCQSLEQTKHKLLSQSPILLFAFAPSSTTPPKVLSQIISTLIQLYPRHVGCISAPLPYQYLDQRMHAESYSCSLAYAFVDGVSFRSAISGPADPHVGRSRWHPPQKQSAEDAKKATPPSTVDSRMQTLWHISEPDGKVNWEHLWDRGTTANSACSLLSTHSNGLDSGTLLDGLQNIDASTVRNIFYFSDKTPEGLETVLQNAFPQANKLSLIASSTPFITGLPVTLFHNGSILSDGAVGIAFTSPLSSLAPMVELSFPPLAALSRNLNVTSSEGNLILSLDSGNPTQLLLNAIRKHNPCSSYPTWLEKEDEFYVGVIDSSTQQVSQLHRINAGDPSRGVIALDAVSAPKAGTIVRLYRLPKLPAQDTPTDVPDTIPNSISLFVASERTSATSFKNEIAGDSVVNAFLAGSEHGFTVSRGTQGFWKCVVPSGRVVLY